MPFKRNARIAAHRSSTSMWKSKQRAAENAKRPDVGVSFSIGSHDCWCGKSFGHDWSGKKDGIAHPK